VAQARPSARAMARVPKRRRLYRVRASPAIHDPFHGWVLGGRDGLPVSLCAAPGARAHPASRRRGRRRACDRPRTRPAAQGGLAFSRTTSTPAGATVITSRSVRAASTCSTARSPAAPSPYCLSRHRSRASFIRSTRTISPSTTNTNASQPPIGSLIAVDRDDPEAMAKRWAGRQCQGRSCPPRTASR
jgi:hypothetical protein